MTELFAEMSIITAYLRRFFTVVEMREYEWRTTRKEPTMKSYSEATFLRRLGLVARSRLSQFEVLEAVRDDNLSGLVECDITVPDDLRYRFG